MNLYSIILGIILLMGLCYIYSSNIEGFREGQAQEGSDVFVKADIGIVVSGAGLGAVNGKYAAGVGPGRIAAYCKKENKEQYCDKSKPWYFNVKNKNMEIWWGPENRWFLGSKNQDHKTAPYVNNFTGSNPKNPPQTGWMANTGEGGTPPKLSGKSTSPIAPNQVTCELTLSSSLNPKGNRGGSIEHKGKKLPTYPLYDKEDKGVKEGKMIRFTDDGKGSIVVKGKNNESTDGCQSAGFIASCRAADKNPWNNFGTNLKRWTAEGLSGKEFNPPTIKPCSSSAEVSLMRNEVNRVPKGETIWAGTGQSDVKFEGGPNYGPFPPPAPACPGGFKGYVQKILSWGKDREDGAKDVETGGGVVGLDSANAKDVVALRPQPRELTTWPKQPKFGPWQDDKISRKFIDKKGTLHLTTDLNKKSPMKIPNAVRKCFDNTNSIFTGVDIPAIEHCIDQKGFECLKCKQYYAPSKPGGRKCIVKPIEYCETQKGTICEKCMDGYKASQDKRKCMVVAIPYCKKQNKNLCDECLPGYRLQEDKKACPKEVGACLEQKKGVCLKCEKRFQLNAQRTGCTPLPIEFCEKQEGITCTTCEKGYRKSADSYTCGMKPIEHCIDQPEDPGYICNKCERGYELKPKREKCWAAAIPNCKVQEDVTCKMCEDGHTLRENECIKTDINYCAEQDGTKCLKCLENYELIKNRCVPIEPIKGCAVQKETECLECEKHHTLTSGACLPTDYGKIDNCQEQLHEKCVICNQNFKLVNGKCERHPGVPDCSIQKGNVCLQCKKGFTLRENMCLPGDLQALAKEKRKPQSGGLERCPPLPECSPSCVDGQGTCVQGLCVCNEGWAGEQCQTKLEPLCPVPSAGPPRRWSLIDTDGTKISKKKFHTYNNTSTTTIPILRKMKDGLKKILGTMGPDPNDCATQESCPAPGAMTTEELQRWADRLREVRETKRCTPETCKTEEKESDQKDISVTGEGKNILKVSAKEGSKEGFQGSFFPSLTNYSTPKLSLGPRRTSNMFGAF